VKKLVLIASILFLVACSTNQVWKSSPIKQTAKNSCFSTRLDPAYDQNKIIGFDIKVKNNCEEDVEIIWNKTRFVFNGKTLGNFIFRDEDYKSCGKSRPSEVVKGGSVISKRIYPMELTDFEHPFTPLKEGKNGVYVTVKKGLRGYHETLLLNISIQKM